jgi:hypothetical protein
MGGNTLRMPSRGFMLKAGIKRELIVPYTPQRNGVSERKNRAIVCATKEMLHDQNIPKFLWAEA